MFERFKSKKTKKPNYPTRDEFEKLEKLVNTHQDFLNNIYLFHELEPGSYMELMRSISFELLYFFDYVCKKHDIEYWLDYGTLLGAVRHEDFIPCDDDLDVGMMRKDYFRFIDVIQKEIDDSGLVMLLQYLKFM